MNREVCFWMLAPCLTFVMAGCEGAVQSGQAVSEPELSQQLTEAIQDLAGRLDVQSDDIKVIVEKNVSWRDGSLGCPRKGMMYTQALVPGALIVLGVGEKEYEYHSGNGGDPTFCATPQAPAPSTTSAD